MDKILNDSIDNIINNTKLLIYKENSLLFDRLRFDDDETFLEPLLFCYFYSKKNTFYSVAILEQLMQGYFINKGDVKIEKILNDDQLAYIPNMGYYTNSVKKDSVIKTEDIYNINHSKIGLIKNFSPILDVIFQSIVKNYEKEEIIEFNSICSDKNITFLKNAFKFIEIASPEYYNYIKMCCKNILMFKSNPEHFNSFATINAHGIAFLNVYQENYNEVFFVDDLAHQTGHIIMNTFWFDKKKHFLIDENFEIKICTDNPKEYRSFFILFHALYTYYASVSCLENCIDKDFFDDDQNKEAIARIGFYERKYRYDLECFAKVCEHFKGIDNVIKEDSKVLYSQINKKFLQLEKRWIKVISPMSFTNQSYNFDFTKFKKENNYEC